MIILGATYARAPQGFAPLAIGLALTLIHLISIPVTNTSVNPAHSCGCCGWHRCSVPLEAAAPWLAGEGSKPLDLAAPSGTAI